VKKKEGFVSYGFGVTIKGREETQMERRLAIAKRKTKVIPALTHEWYSIPLI